MKRGDVEKFISTISIGHQSAKSPPEEIATEVSKQINKQNLKGDVIINSKNGYYRPYPFDEEDDNAFNEYIESELDRAEEIISRCQSMKMTYEIIIESIEEKWRTMSS